MLEIVPAMKSLLQYYCNPLENCHTRTPKPFWAFLLAQYLVEGFWIYEDFWNFDGGHHVQILKSRNCLHRATWTWSVLLVENCVENHESSFSNFKKL